MRKPKLCSICYREFTEYGNNAEPINDGRCCDDCDNQIVIPARIQLIRIETARARAGHDAPTSKRT